MGLYDKYLSAQDRYYKYWDDNELEGEVFEAYHEAQAILVSTYVNTIVKL
jgi:hypothetical protein